VRGSTFSVRGEPLTIILTSVRTSLCACAGYVVFNAVLALNDLFSWLFVVGQTFCLLGSDV
jgi:hypothetical protein